MRRTLLALTLIAIACRNPEGSKPAAGGEAPADAVIAVGATRYFDRPAAEALWNAASDETRQRFAARGKRGYFEEFAERELFVLEAESSGLDQRPDVRARLELRRGEVLYEVMAEKLVLAEIGEDEAKAFYEAHKAELFTHPDRFRVRMIAVTPRAEKEPPNSEHDDATTPEGARRKIELMRQRAEFGEDFADLARRYSEHSSASSGGELTIADADSTPAPVRQALAKLSPGGVTPVIPLETGFLIYRLEEKLAAGAQPYAEVGEEVRRAILGRDNARAMKIYGEIRDRLKEKYPITIRAEK